MPRKRRAEQVLAGLRRRAVREHAAAERRRRHVPILHVGVPGAAHEVFAIVPDEPVDHALRTDVVAALRHRADLRADLGADLRGPRAGRPAPLVWLTRGGDLDLQDLDVAWHAAARQAYAEAGVALCFTVVNRHGWHDPGTGARREWVRPRRST